MICGARRYSDGAEAEKLIFTDTTFNTLNDLTHIKGTHILRACEPARQNEFNDYPLLCVDEAASLPDACNEESSCPESSSLYGLT